MLDPLVREGSLRRLPLRFRTRDGEVRDIFISAELISLEGERCILALHEMGPEG